MGSEHGLARMFQRAPSIDAAAALHEAALCFLAADRRAVEAARLGGQTLCLKAGPGLLLCLSIAGPDLEGKMRLIARANTWIAADMAAADQTPLIPAVDPARSVLAANIAGDEEGARAQFPLNPRRGDRGPSRHPSLFY